MCNVPVAKTGDANVAAPPVGLMCSLTVRPFRRLVVADPRIEVRRQRCSFVGASSIARMQWRLRGLGLQPPR